MPNTIRRDMTLAEFAATISAHLSADGIDCVLTGGACVSIYTENQYESGDADFISRSEQSRIVDSMKKLGFAPSSPGAKSLGHPKSEFTVEFPGREIYIGDERQTETAEIQIKGLKLKLLSPTQSTMDRLAAYLHWKDPQGLDQAGWICERHPVLLSRVYAWAKAEGASAEQLQAIKRRCDAGQKKRTKTK